jgi:cytochrome c-type biogenesis protein CcmH
MIRLLAAVFLLVGTAAFAVSDPSEMMQNPKQEARAEALGSQLRCLVCQNESIEDSDAPLAHDLRAIMRQHIAAGETDAQIMDWMVARYGVFVRLKPPLMLSTALLWATPFLGLIIGGLAAWFGRRHRGAAPAPLTQAEQIRVAELTQAP